MGRVAQSAAQRRCVYAVVPEHGRYSPGADVGGVRQVPVQMWRHPPVPRAAHRDRLAGLPPVRRVQKRAATAGHDEHWRICAALRSSPSYQTVLRVPKPKSTESTETKHRQSRRLRARRRSRRQVRAD